MSIIGHPRVRIKGHTRFSKEVPFGTWVVMPDACVDFEIFVKDDTFVERSWQKITLQWVVVVVVVVVGSSSSFSWSLVLAQSLDNLCATNATHPLGSHYVVDVGRVLSTVWGFSIIGNNMKQTYSHSQSFAWNFEMWRVSKVCHSMVPMQKIKFKNGPRIATWHLTLGETFLGRTFQKRNHMKSPCFFWNFRCSSQFYWQKSAAPGIFQRLHQQRRRHRRPIFDPKCFFRRRFEAPKTREIKSFCVVVSWQQFPAKVLLKKHLPGMTSSYP